MKKTRLVLIHGLMTLAIIWFGNETATAQNVVNQKESEQKSAFPKKNEIEEKIFDVVEQPPKFPGGNLALLDYLSNNVQYPRDAEEEGKQGRVVVAFVVEKDGTITNVKVVRSVYPSLDNEAVRIVAAMPKWIPAKQNGEYVRVKYNLPVTFKLP